MQKMSSKKKSRGKKIKNSSLIDISQKQKIEVVYGIPDISDEEYKLLMKRVADSTDSIRASYYSSDAAKDRILSRNFRDISHARLYQILAHKKTSKEQSG